MLTIFHTSDWHFGQNFYNFDRSAEHHAFLTWLSGQVELYHPNVLLVAGDIFHHANPPFTAIQMFYQFLGHLCKKYPQLNIIMIAGNHDSGQKIELPITLLQHKRLHLIGQLYVNQQGCLDCEKHCIPLFGKTDEIIGWCLAIPYLSSLHLQRYHVNHNISYEKKVQHIYHALFDFAMSKMEESQYCIAVGHLFLQATSMTQESERILFDNALPPSVFPSQLDYIALGHLHRSQQVSHCPPIHYSGSPIPLSFSEKDYTHQIKQIILEKKTPPIVNNLIIPRLIPLLSLPPKPLPLEETTFFLQNYLFQEQTHPDFYPFLEIKLLFSTEETAQQGSLSLYEYFIKILKNKPVRLFKIKSFSDTDPKISPPLLEQTNPALGELDPFYVFEQLYQKQKTPSKTIPEAFRTLFEQVLNEALEHK